MQIIKFKDVVVTSLTKGVVFIANECTVQIDDGAMFLNEEFEISLNECYSFESEGTVIRGAAIENNDYLALTKLKENLRCQ